MHTYGNKCVPETPWSCIWCKCWVNGLDLTSPLHTQRLQRQEEWRGGTHLEYCAYGFLALLERSLLCCCCHIRQCIWSLKLDEGASWKIAVIYGFRHAYLGDACLSQSRFLLAGRRRRGSRASVVHLRLLLDTRSSKRSLRLGLAFVAHHGERMGRCGGAM